MPQFSYSAYDSRGKTVRGEVSALNELAALDMIARDALIPIQIKVGREGIKWWQRDLTLGGDTSARPQVLVRFFQLLSIMLGAKYSVPKSLAFCSKQITDPKLRRLLAQAEKKVEDGDSLASALNDGSDTIPSRFLRAIEVGEGSNQLSSVVGQIAKGLDEEQQIRREIKQALVYPIILIAMSVLVVGLLVFYLAPTLVPVFQASQASPPAVLATMDAARLFALKNWGAILIILGVVLLIGVWQRRRLLGYLGRVARFTPGLKSYLIKRQSLTFCQTILQFLLAGDRVQTAVEQSKLAFSDPAWVQFLERAHSDVVDGKTLTQALDGSVLLDPLAFAMIDAGEEGDQLPETLQSIVVTLREQTKQALSQAVKLITPMLTLAIGLCVGAVIMSTISAILDLNDIAF